MRNFLVSIGYRGIPGVTTLIALIKKGSDWIRLVFAHPFPVNSGAPIASGNFISDGKVQVLSYTLIMDLSQQMGATLFKTNGWAQSNCFSTQTLSVENTQKCIQKLLLLYNLAQHFLAGTFGYELEMKISAGSHVFYRHVLSNFVFPQNRAKPSQPLTRNIKSIWCSINLHCCPSS